MADHASICSAHGHSLMAGRFDLLENRTMVHDRFNRMIDVG